MGNNLRKIELYALSLCLLFVFFIIITVNVPLCVGESCSFIGLEELAAKNIVTIFSILALGYCFYAYRRFSFDLKGATAIPFEISKLESINYEHLTFLATYVVPLISFDFESSRQMIVLLLLLVVMGCIYIKTDLFYANPSLALLGFKIYKADGLFKSDETREGVILITKDSLIVSDKVSYIKLDDRIYYAARLK